MVVKIKKKKPITAPDEFISLPNRIVQYVQANLKQVLTITTVCVVLISIFLLGRAWWHKRKEQSFILYTKAENLLKNKQQDKAETVLNQLIKTHSPASNFACLQLATVYEEREQWEKAIIMYQTYLKKSNDKDIFSPFVWHALGCDYWISQKPSEVEKALKNIIKNYPDHPLANWAYINLGLLIEEKEPFKALEMYNLALKKESPLNPPWLDFKIKALKINYPASQEEQDTARREK